MKKKVLLIKLSALGDVIFNIPLANALKKAGILTPVLFELQLEPTLVLSSGYGTMWF